MSSLKLKPSAAFALILLGSWGTFSVAGKALQIDIQIIRASINEKIDVVTGAEPLSEVITPSRLRQIASQHSMPYVKIVSFSLEPGSHYTLYTFFPKNQTGENMLLMGENPLSDLPASHRSGAKYTHSHVVLSDTSFRPPECDQLVNRLNFSISADSTDNLLYLVCMSREPGQPMGLLVKSPPDPDEDVATSKNNPYCPERDTATWGAVIEPPFLLKQTSAAGDDSQDGTTDEVSSSGESFLDFDVHDLVGNWQLYIDNLQDGRVAGDAERRVVGFTHNNENTFRGSYILQTSPMGNFGGRVDEMSNSVIVQIHYRFQQDNRDYRVWFRGIVRSKSEITGTWYDNEGGRGDFRLWR